MKFTLIKFVFLLVFTSIFIYLYIMKTNENLQLGKKVSQYKLLQKQLKIKFFDNEHLVFDKNSQIKYQKNGLLVLDVFIKNFYFGNISRQAFQKLYIKSSSVLFSL